jgi:hypothetical protein
LRVIVLQSLAGLLIGFGAGLVLGFCKLALGEKSSPSGSFGMMLVPTGWLRVGLFGGILMGLAGGVIGLITGALSLGALQAAVVGIVIWLLLKWRTLYSDLRSFPRAVGRYLRGERTSPRAILQDIIVVSLVLDLPLVGAIVAVSLRRLFGE